MNFIDICSGAGGLSLGFVHAGFDHLFGVDNWSLACRAYEMNVGKCICANIEDFDGTPYRGTVDVVVGSPPCQTFSSANIHSRSCDMALTNEYFRIVGQIKPKIWVMENVPNIISYLDVPFKTVFDMSEYGLLQARKRCFASNVILEPKKQTQKYLNGGQLSRVSEFRPEAIHKLFQTVTCRYNSYGGTDARFRDQRGVRLQSHVEALQIQTFPFYYKIPDAGQREIETLIGNAVPPLFAYQVALSICEHTEKQQTLVEMIAD